MKKRALGGLLAMSVGVAVACTVQAMPPVGIVRVSLTDIVSAWWDGYKNPARAAALRELDEAASGIVGEEAWLGNEFRGHVTYRFLNGSHIQYEEKACNEKAEEQESDNMDDDGSPNPPSGGGGGASGDPFQYGGLTGFGSDGCIGDCDISGTVTVGQIGR